MRIAFRRLFALGALGLAAFGAHADGKKLRNGSAQISMAILKSTTSRNRSICGDG